MMSEKQSLDRSKDDVVCFMISEKDEKVEFFIDIFIISFHQLILLDKLSAW